MIAKRRDLFALFDFVTKRWCACVIEIRQRVMREAPPEPVQVINNGAKEFEVNLHARGKQRATHSRSILGRKT